MSSQRILHVHRQDTLLNFISRKLRLSKNRAKQLLDSRKVFVNKRRAWIASYELRTGDVIEILIDTSEIQAFPKYTVLFHDNNYLIVSKPPGILTTGTGGLEGKLRQDFKNPHIRAAHRLDRNTSGVVIFAMSNEAFEHMKNLFKESLIQKVYRVIVRGKVHRQSFTISTPIRGQGAVTHVRLLKKGKTASYLEVSTETGRTHQIRIHLSSIGCPVVGETEYDRKPINHHVLRRIGRQMLHAHRVSFVHPYTHERLSVKAPLPGDFCQNLKLLNLAE